MLSDQNNKQKVLIVDDEPANLRVLKKILGDLYRLTFAKSGEEALRLVERELPDLILLDVMMPGMTGFDVCQALKQNPLSKGIPVMFVTALSDDVDEAKGFDVGAVDYITKPVSPAVVKARVRTHLSLVQADELRRTRLQVIQRLGRASEYKDNETGTHILRMSHYSKIMALALGLSENAADNLLHAAPMHDIGKIGIPDSIMLKPGKLTDEEFAIMQKHPEIGAEILGESDSDLIELAKIVSLTHHEKWDGSGYPNGLKGEEIPLEGRIVAIADVFDALTSKRPYKEAWPVEKAVDLIQSQSGKHFDPNIVTLFQSCLPSILEIKERWQDA
ncbi:response regulator [Paraglaciecola chathamensis]|jgi:putative two-component system response regulator|uniref:Response regulator rpfG n=1 Tax=Paraglaciecola agarilytica NO2 TaxID=1125747 RepID=A0ABQ0ICN6_9ALTE|nr:two-component system response regulator [Paraglaciecola agarilytica]GAC07163.1 response regulator rpfG [Paraglaciecola agarilytica NO2]